MWAREDASFELHVLDLESGNLLKTVALPRPVWLGPITGRNLLTWRSIGAPDPNRFSMVFIVMDIEANKEVVRFETSDAFPGGDGGFVSVGQGLGLCWTTHDLFLLDLPVS